MEENNSVNENVETENVETQEVETEIVDSEETSENVVDFENNKLQKDFDDLEDKHKRLQAEYSNFMRRSKEEKDAIGILANEKIISDLLPVIDSMEMALKSFEDKDSTVYKGIELVQKNLSSTMTKYGVEEIEALDCEFDPNLHLAVMQESVDGVDANKVIDVMQKGYKLGKKILRPSMVKVSN